MARLLLPQLHWPRAVLMTDWSYNPEGLLRFYRVAYIKVSRAVRGLVEIQSWGLYGYSSRATAARVTIFFGRLTLPAKSICS